METLFPVLGGSAFLFVVGWERTGFFVSAALAQLFSRRSESRNANDGRAL